MIQFIIGMWSSLAHAEPEYSTVPWTKEQAQVLEKGDKEVNLWPAAAGTRQWLGRKRPTHPVFWAPGAMVKELWADGDHQWPSALVVCMPRPC